MYLFASLVLSFAFLCTILFALLLAVQLCLGEDRPLGNPEKWMALLHFPASIGMTIASAILLYAFISYDFQVEYVYNYSDLTLPLFYRITSFWAGQAGSMLFWAWSVAISGFVFSCLNA